MKNFSKKLAVALIVVMKGAVGFFAGTIGLLAGSARTSSSNDATANAASGGILNNRTGKLDDGTDPGGMY